MTQKDWTHQSLNIDTDKIYRQMMHGPWAVPDGHETPAIHYGLSYKQGGGCKRGGEIPEIPDFLKKPAELIAVRAEMPSNYIQCHRKIESSQVRPHRDPSGMTVPMLTLGQERTFRVGGTYPAGMKQAERPVDCHVPDEEILMRHGDLLIFNGGRVAHSMHVADKDPRFNRNGYDFRISILFRWTTSITWEMGPDRRNWSPAQIQQHEREYTAARVRWTAEHQMQPSLF